MKKFFMNHREKQVSTNYLKKSYMGLSCALFIWIGLNFELTVNSFEENVYAEIVEENSLVLNYYESSPVQDSDQSFYPLRVYKDSQNNNNRFGVFYNSETKQLKINQYHYDMTTGEYGLPVISTILHAGEKVTYSSVFEFAVRSDGNYFYYLDTSNSRGMYLLYNWADYTQGRNTNSNILWYDNGYNTLPGIPLPATIPVIVTYRDSNGNRIKDDNGILLEDQMYSINQGQKYEYNNFSIPIIKNFEVTFPENISGVANSTMSVINIQIVYIYDEEGALEEKRVEQKKKLQEIYNRTIEVIKNDVTLTNEEKERQIFEASEVLQIEQENIDNSVTVETIGQEYEVGKKAIEGVHVSGKSLENQKTEQKEKLQVIHDQTVEAIKNDVTLTNKEQEKQILDVNEALRNEQGKIDSSATADEISEVYDIGKEVIEATHIPNKSLEEQKVEKKKKLEAIFEQTIETIKNDMTLSSEEKERQISEGKEALMSEQENIDHSVTADEIKQKYEVGEKTIEAKYVPGNSLEEQKAEKKKRLQGVHSKTIEAIKNDVTLTSKEKKKQIEGVNKIFLNEQENIDKSITADEVNQRFDKGKTAIEGIHVSGKSLEKQKTEKIKKLQELYNRIVLEIRNDSTLTSNEKQNQIYDINKVMQNERENIIKSANASEVNQRYLEGKKAIEEAFNLSKRNSINNVSLFLTKHSLLPKAGENSISYYDLLGVMIVAFCLIKMFLKKKINSN